MCDAWRVLRLCSSALHCEPVRTYGPHYDQCTSLLPILTDTHSVTREIQTMGFSWALHEKLTSFCMWSRVSLVINCTADAFDRRNSGTIRRCLFQFLFFIGNENFDGIFWTTLMDMAVAFRENPSLIYVWHLVCILFVINCTALWASEDMWSPYDQCATLPPSHSAWNAWRREKYKLWASFLLQKITSIRARSCDSFVLLCTCILLAINTLQRRLTDETVCALRLCSSVLQRRLTDEMVAQFVDAWQDLDPLATEYIPAEQILSLFSKIDRPLGLGVGASKVRVASFEKSCLLTVRSFGRIRERLHYVSEALYK